MPLRNYLFDGTRMILQNVWSATDSDESPLQIVHSERWNTRTRTKWHRVALLAVSLLVILYTYLYVQYNIRSDGCGYDSVALNFQLLLYDM